MRTGGKLDGRASYHQRSPASLVRATAATATAATATAAAATNMMSPMGVGPLARSPLAGQVVRSGQRHAAYQAFAEQRAWRSAIWMRWRWRRRRRGPRRLLA